MIPNEIIGIGFGNIERNILATLSDGVGHSVDSLRKCLWDEMGERLTVQVHISRIRKKIVLSTYRIYSGHEQGLLVYRLLRLTSGIDPSVIQ